MTKRRAEQLTGYEIRRLSASQHPVIVGAFNGEDLVATARNLTERLALRDLVARVYRLNCFAALKRFESPHGDIKSHRALSNTAQHPIAAHDRRYPRTNNPHLDWPACWWLHEPIGEILH